MLMITRARAALVARLVVGSLLLLPAFLAFGLVLWYPGLHTLALSLQAVALERHGHFAGLANYLDLWQDPLLGPAIGHSLLAALAWLAAVLPIPALAGWLWARQRPEWPLLARLMLSLGLALSAPAAVGLLWRLAVLRVPWLQGFSLVSSSQALRSYLLLEFVAALGLGGALTATALLSAWRRPRPTRAVAGVLALAGILALSSGLNAFSLGFVATGGGPGGRTLTLALHAFRTAFLDLRLGQAAAQATLLLVASLALGLVFGTICEGLDLRLEPARRERPAYAPARYLPAGLVALGLLVVPPLLLYLWGAGMTFLSAGDPLAHAASALQPELALANGILAPAVAIALVQLPVSYLAALSLAVIRPFGRVASRAAFVLLLASGFVPPTATAIGLYDVVRRLHMLHTLPAFGLPLVAGAASLTIFRLYFAGREPAFAEAVQAGQPAPAALFQHVVRPSLPATALAGVISLALAGQSLLWPVLVLSSSETFPLSLQLAVFQTRFASNPPALAAGAWLLATVWGLGFLLLWWPLQVLVLDRLDLATPKLGDV